MTRIVKPSEYIIADVGTPAIWDVLKSHNSRGDIPFFTHREELFNPESHVFCDVGYDIDGYPAVVQKGDYMETQVYGDSSEEWEMKGRSDGRFTTLSTTVRSRISSYSVM